MSKDIEAAAIVAKNDNREKVIVRTSVIGILANILLAMFKAAVGLLSNSIAVVLDAVNNLSDALSSVITIIGTKLAGKAPDKKHPYGYGRIEYMSELIVAAIVLYAGITSLTESVKKIIHPQAADYSITSLIIITAAIVVKLILGAYVKKKGKEVNSGSLIASGSDASFDAILSASVLASAIIYIVFGISLEAWVGVIIALFIIKSGTEMIKDALDEILGARVSGDITKEIKRIVGAYPQVHGVYDVFLNNYGPDKYTGSLHVEVADNMSASDFDKLTRKISDEVYAKTNVIFTAVGLYAANLGDDEAGRIRSDVYKIVMSHDFILQIHGFYLDRENKIMTFDVVIDFEAKDRKAILNEIREDIKKKYPDYNITVTPDTDVSDI